MSIALSHHPELSHTRNVSYAHVVQIASPCPSFLFDVTHSICLRDSLHFIIFTRFALLFLSSLLFTNPYAHQTHTKHQIFSYIIPFDGVAQWFELNRNKIVKLLDENRGGTFTRKAESSAVFNRWVIDLNSPTINTNQMCVFFVHSRAFYKSNI